MSSFHSPSPPRGQFCMQYAGWPDDPTFGDLLVDEERSSVGATGGRGKGRSRTGEEAEPAKNRIISND